MMFETLFLKRLKFGDQLIAVDEVGRGPLAGPVVCCAFSFLVCKDAKERLKKLNFLGITDSKKLSPKRRRKILDDLGILDFKSISSGQKYFLCLDKTELGQFYLAERTNTYIDEKNILFSTMNAMDEAVLSFVGENDWFALIDGNKLPPEIEKKEKGETIVKGDLKSVLISLASIIAKEYRDFLMHDYAKVYPGYDLEKNSGYPTKKHLEALKTLGPTPIHRRTFKGVLSSEKGT